MSSELISPYELTPAWLSWASSGMAITLALSGVLGTQGFLPIDGIVSYTLLSLALITFLIPFTFGTLKWFNMYSVNKGIEEFTGSNISLVFSLTYPIHYMASILLLGAVLGIVPLAVPIALFVFTILTSILFPTGVIVRKELQKRQQNSAPDEKLN